jgi:eukaryotic-like serine/threonine-protein kinase
MGRCARCHRRLAAGARCARDGGAAGDEAVGPDGEATAPPEPPEFPGHRVVRLLGAGGFASVWEAEADGPPVAVKVSHAGGPAVEEQFAREAEALRRVGSPHVPSLVATGVLPGGRAYIAMERLRSSPLSAHLEAMAAPPPWSQVSGLFGAVLDAVAAVHRAGLVHRDLKPENIFLAGSPPRATLIDLGLASDAADRPAAGSAEARAGTPEYMAPEQTRGEAIDARTDVYALGVILFELLTGRPPFAGDRAEVELGHLNLRPPRPSSLAPMPAALEEALLRCLAKEPDQRPASVDDLRAALAAVPIEPTVDAAAPAATTDAGRPAPAATDGQAGNHPAAKAAPAKESASRPRAALLFCRIDPERTIDVRGALEAGGGLLAHVAGDTLVGAFTAQSGDHPVRRALAAARGLVDRGLCRAIVLDLQSIAAVPRPGGPPRLMSPLFARPERYPARGDPAGVLMTAAARDALADVAVEPVTGRADRFALRPEQLDGRSEPTMFQRQGEPLIGRAPVVDELSASARESITSRAPAIATVIGEQGLGKSHLAAVLIERLTGELPAADVISLRCSEPIAGDTERFLAQLLRLALGIGDVRPTEGRRLVEERLGAELAAEVHSAVALVLGWVGADDPGVARLRGTPGVLRASTARALGEGLRRRAQRRPLCIVVDDAHWVDPTSLDGLEYATADDADAPLWLAVIARPGFEQARPAWGTRAARSTSLRLGPLDSAAAAELCRRLLAPVEHVPQSAIDRLVERSQANPLLMVDLVGGLKRQGLVNTRVGGGGSLVTELLDQMPDMPLVEWIAAREIESLPPDLAGYGRLGALLGADFTAAEFEGIALQLERDGASPSGEFRTDARVGIRQLCEAGLLVRHRDDRYGFRNSLSRQAVAAAVPEAHRRRVERAALAYYRRATELDPTRRLPRLAFHAAAVGERAEAAAVYLELADGARARHAYLEAELLYSRALDCLDDSDEARRLAAARGRGIMRYRVGRYEDSLADLRLARDLAGRRGDRQLEADLLLDAAMALDWLEEWRESREATARAAELVTDDDPPLLRARLLQALGRSANRFNQDLEGIRYYEQAIAVAEPLGDEGYEVVVTSLLLLGFVLPFVGRADDAAVCLERALALCQSKADELHLGAVFNNRSCLWIALNDQRRALDDMDRARAYSRRLGISNLERMVELNLGIYLYWLGELDAAAPHVERLIELDHRRMRSGVRPDGQVLRARLLFVRGDLDACRREVVEVARHQDEAGRQHARDMLLMPSDRVLFDAVTLAVSGGSAADWDEVCSRAGQVSQGQELLEVMELCGLAAERRGELDAARRAWDSALEAGARIPNVFEDRLRRRLAGLAQPRG